MSIHPNHFSDCNINTCRRDAHDNPVSWECTCADRKKIAYNKAYERAKREIVHTSDGPVTRFVAIARAIDLARSGAFKVPGVDDPIANALDDVLGGDSDRVLIDSYGS